MSILDRLSYNDKRVFDIDLNADGAFDVREGCDQYFHETLTAEELEKLGHEIIELAREQKESEK